MSHDLLLPLSEVPGLDATGLPALLADGHRGVILPGGVLFHLDRRQVYLAGNVRGIDLADSATRDRVVRWVAGRLGLTLGSSTAPEWFGRRGAWELNPGTGSPDIEVVFVRPVGSYSGAYGPIVPTLAELDCDDDARLPDGSRAVDARALLLVAQWLGRRP